jgi:hypothetical protein
MAQHAVAAYSDLDGKTFQVIACWLSLRIFFLKLSVILIIIKRPSPYKQGRLLHILPSKSKNKEEDATVQPASNSYKKVQARCGQSVTSLTLNQRAINSGVIYLYFFFFTLCLMSVQKREQELKGNSEAKFNWNTLFLRADTVASAMAASYGMDKGDVLDPVSCLDRLYTILECSYRPILLLLDQILFDPINNMCSGS